MLVSRFGFDKVPTNVPTKRRDVSEQLANVGGHSIVVGYWKIVKNIVPADDDEWLRTLADQRCGGPGRTRTCNQTVMSGGISISFVDFTVILFDPVRIRCASIGLILVRNWCGPRLAIEIHSHTYFGRWHCRYQTRREKQSCSGAQVKRTRYARPEFFRAHHAPRLLTEACLLRGLIRRNAEEIVVTTPVTPTVTEGEGVTVALRAALRCVQ